LYYKLFWLNWLVCVFLCSSSLFTKCVVFYVFSVRLANSFCFVRLLVWQACHVFLFSISFLPPAALGCQTKPTNRPSYTALASNASSSLSILSASARLPWAFAKYWVFGYVIGIIQFHPYNTVWAVILRL